MSHTDELLQSLAAIQNQKQVSHTTIEVFVHSNAMHQPQHEHLSLLNAGNNAHMVAYHASTLQKLVSIQPRCR